MAASRSTQMPEMPEWIHQWSAAAISSEDENRRYSMSDVRSTRNGDTPVPRSTKTGSFRRNSGWKLMNDQTPTKSSDFPIGRQRATVLFDAADGGQLVVSYDAPDHHHQQQRNATSKRESLGTTGIRRPDNYSQHPPTLGINSSSSSAKSIQEERAVIDVDVQRTDQPCSRATPTSNETIKTKSCPRASSDDVGQAGLDKGEPTPNSTVNRRVEPDEDHIHADNFSYVEPTAAMAFGSQRRADLPVRKLPETALDMEHASCCGSGSLGVERQNPEQIGVRALPVDSMDQSIEDLDSAVLSTGTGSSSSLFKIPRPVLRQGSCRLPSSAGSSTASVCRLSKTPVPDPTTIRTTVTTVVGKSMLPAMTSKARSISSLSLEAPASATKKTESEKSKKPNDVMVRQSSNHSIPLKHSASSASVCSGVRPVITSGTSATTSTSSRQRPSGTPSTQSGRDVQPSVSLHRTTPTINSSCITSVAGTPQDSVTVAMGSASTGNAKAIKRVTPALPPTRRTSLGTASLGRPMQPASKITTASARTRISAVEQRNSVSGGPLKSLSTTTRLSGTRNVGSVAKLNLTKLAREDKLEHSPSPLVSPLSPSSWSADQLRSRDSTGKELRKKWDLSHCNDPNALVKSSMYCLARRLHGKVDSLIGDKAATDMSDDDDDDVYENEDTEELPQWKTSDPYLAGIMRRLLSVDQKLSTMTRTHSERESASPVCDDEGTATTASNTSSTPLDAATGANGMLMNL